MIEQAVGTSTPEQRGLRYDYEIMEDLKKAYSGQIRKLPSGMDYVEWNEKVRVANEVFGSLNWSTAIVQAPTLVGDIGFVACKKITVTFIDSYSGAIRTTSHEGTGFSAIGNMTPDRAYDTATKAADSDALSKTFANFGDAFALFLWGKDRPTTPTTNAAPPRAERAASTARPTATADALTDKQREILTNLKVPAKLLARVTKKMAMSSDRIEGGGNLIGLLMAKKQERGRAYGESDAVAVLAQEFRLTDGSTPARRDDYLDNYGEDEQYPDEEDM